MSAKMLASQNELESHVSTFQVVQDRPVPASEVFEQASLLSLRIFTLRELEPYLLDDRRFSIQQTHLVAADTSDGRRVYVVEFFSDEELQKNAKIRCIGKGDKPGCNPNLPWLFRRD